MSGQVVLRGEVNRWDLAEPAREYIRVTVPFGVARQVFKAKVFSGESGYGEQRNEIESWTRKLQREIESGNYTPTPISVGTRAEHRKLVERSEHHMMVEGQQVSTTVAEIKLDSDEVPTMPLLNGWQRFCALNRIRKNSNEERQKLVDKQPIDAIIYLDGSTKTDFINLNQGKSIDTSMLLSLKVHQKALPEKDQANYTTAIAVAKAMSNNPTSPFYKQIRLDTKGVGGLPVSSLCQKGSSDLSTSLIGLAKVANKLTADQLSAKVTEVFNLLQKSEPSLLEEGRVLTPPPNGTKGAAGMLIGLAVCYVYRLNLPLDADQENIQKSLVRAAKSALDTTVDGNFSGPEKRNMMGEFAQEFFSDCNVEKHGGVPKELVEILSASTFNLPKLVKEPKKRGRKKVLVEDKDVVTEKDLVAPTVVNEENVGVEDTFEPKNNVAPWDTELQA